MTKGQTYVTPSCEEPQRPANATRQSIPRPPVAPPAFVPPELRRGAAGPRLERRKARAELLRHGARRPAVLHHVEVAALPQVRVEAHLLRGQHGGGGPAPPPRT